MADCCYHSLQVGFTRRVTAIKKIDYKFNASLFQIVNCTRSEKIMVDTIIRNFSLNRVEIL